MLKSVFTMAVVLIAALAAAGCSGSPLSSPMTITAQFDNANGLYKGNTVAILGMKVGKVVNIVPRGDHVEVTMEVDSGTKIPAQAHAVTVTDSVLTDRHVELTPVYKSGPLMQDNAELGLDQTNTPVEFDSLLSMADKLSKSLSGDGEGSGPIADLVNVGAAMTDGNGEAMKNALGELSRALQLDGPDNGQATRNAITEVINNLNSLTAAAATNDTTIRQFGSAVHQMSDLLNDQQLGTGDTGAKLNQILTSATQLLEKHRGTLKTMATNSQVASKTMADNNRNIGEFLDVFPMVVDNAYLAIDQENKAVRAHLPAEKIVFDGQLMKEVCNVLKIKRLGCDTGRAADFGPDFGVTAMMAGLAGLPR